jgi:hypothetical protein
MGTRNLTCVFHEGTYKIAKYGQWDGYPDHLGVNILDFLLNRFEKETFIKNLGKIRFISDEELKSLWQKAGSDNSGWVNMEVSENFKKSEYPLSRDCSGLNCFLLYNMGRLTSKSIALILLETVCFANGVMSSTLIRILLKYTKALIKSHWISTNGLVLSDHKPRIILLLSM